MGLRRVLAHPGYLSRGHLCGIGEERGRGLPPSRLRAVFGRLVKVLLKRRILCFFAGAVFVQKIRKKEAVATAKVKVGGRF